MPNLKGLRIRIRSIRNTVQLTKTMSMIAASKMRKAQQQAFLAQDYLATLLASLEKLASDSEDKLFHQFLHGNKAGGSLVVLLSTNRGLCGSLNTNLFKKVLTEEANLGENIYYFSMGRKGYAFLQKTRKEIKKNFDYSEEATVEDAAYIAETVKKSYNQKLVGKVFIAYPHFISTLKQEPVLEQILPISLADQHFTQSPILEPNGEEVVNLLTDWYLRYKIFQSLSEARASEHSARMVAMQNATDNGEKLVDTLVLQYNKMRQETITRELLDIAGASAGTEEW